MTPPFIIRPEAQAEIQDAFEWYENQSPGLGDEFLGAVDAGLVAIQETPQRFPTVYREPDIVVRRGRLRRFPYGLYFIWDETGSGGTAVIACMHGRRNPRRWQRRM